MANKDSKSISKSRRPPPTLKEKPEKRAKTKKLTGGKKQSKDLDELAQTWNEDLCE